MRDDDRMQSKKALLIDLIQGDGQERTQDRNLKSKLTQISDFECLSVVSLGDAGRVIDTQDIDLVIVSATYVDETLKASLEIFLDKAERPAVFFCANGAPECIRAAVEAGVHACSTMDLAAENTRDDVLATLEEARAQYEKIQILRSELESTKTALEDRKVIERAKGIVMREKGLGEDDAYKLLRSRAMQKGQRLVQVARTVIDAVDTMNAGALKENGALERSEA